MRKSWKFDWLAQVGKRGRCRLRTVLGDVEFVDDTATCLAASFAPAVEQLFDWTLSDWSQRRNVGKTERMHLEFRSVSLRKVV